MNIFKKLSEPPAAKPSSFTTDQIISDIKAILKHDSNSETSNPFYVNHSESWYTELKEYTKVTNDLLDAVEAGAEQKDDILKLKKDLCKDMEDIKQKTQDVLQNI